MSETVLQKPPIVLLAIIHRLTVNNTNNHDTCDNRQMCTAGNNIQTAVNSCLQQFYSCKQLFYSCKSVVPCLTKNTKDILSQVL